jgi:hypothetical protein
MIGFISTLLTHVGTSHNHRDGETPSITVRRTGILLGQQTPRSERRQNSYTAAHGQPIQALANQRTQLQLRLQLARTEPSFNGIKRGPQQPKSVNQHPRLHSQRESVTSVHQFQYDQQSFQIGSIISSSAIGGSSSRQQPPLAWAATLRTIDSRPYLRRQHALATRRTQQSHAS